MDGPRIHPRSIGDERLIEAFRGDGCPLCRHMRRVGLEHLASIMEEQVTDRDFRRRFLEGGGFCARHTRQAAQVERGRKGGATGAAILFRSILSQRRTALAQAIAPGRGAARKRREAVEPASDCPVCAQERIGAHDTAHRLAVHASEDAAWRDAITNATWCLPHLAVISEAALDTRDAPLLATLRDAQLARLADVDARLERFVHHSSHDRRHRQTEDERASVAEASRILGGEPD